MMLAMRFSKVPLVVLAWFGSFGCVFVVEEDDTGDSDFTGESGSGEPPPPPTTGTPDPNTSTAPAGETDTDTDSTTGGEDLECSVNLVVDPGFEAGLATPWSQNSLVFGSVLCNGECVTPGEEANAQPNAGDWWVWFGGLTELTEESAFVAQTLVIAEGDTAQLSFFFWIASAAETGDDTFRVLLDDEELLLRTDADFTEAPGYEQITVDVSDFADGAEHELRFEGEFPGTGTRTNFFVDDVEIVSCTTAVDGTSSGSSAGSDSDVSSGSGSSESSSSGSTETGEGETTEG